ncbi:hypothetical protein GW924_02270 [Candidatus Pacearchaeota archaeon]|nr:hypothetical protein [Candidatus Pacearchaeota archaeon]
MVDNFSHELEKLMDECGIPEEVMVNFREGRGKLSGFYYLYDDIVSGNVVVMDIYTKPLLKLKGRELDRELLDTFVHEIIHHSVKSERKTNERVKEFMEGLDL